MNAAEKRKPIINVHCHLLNFKFIPNTVIKHLAVLPAFILKRRSVSYILDWVMKNIPGKAGDRIKRFLDIYRHDIDEVTRRYILELTAAGIDICAPLMMDLFQAAPGSSTTKNTRYHRQIDLISKEVAKYPWRIFPFVMFDPRRKGADILCIRAMEEKGFVGVKLYPALGYHPSPDAAEKRFLNGTSPATVRENLLSLYDYCKNRKVPITVHASCGGAYSTDMDRDRERYAWPLTDPANWRELIEKYQLKINFAHLGGNYFHESKTKRIKGGRWRRKILAYIAKSRREDHFGEVYADLAYHNMAHDPEISPDYFWDLAELLNNKKYEDNIIYGSDASMISHTWLEADFAEPFRTFLDAPTQDKIFTKNPTNFLFGKDGKIPENYVAFLKKKGKIKEEDPAKDLPEWIRYDGKHYYIVKA